MSQLLQRNDDIKEWPAVVRARWLFRWAQPEAHSSRSAARERIFEEEEIEHLKEEAREAIQAAESETAGPAEREAAKK